MTALMQAGGASPWWLSGGIASANCVAAYQPKGAASLAASYINLANPGTYDAAPGVAPSWAAATGWTFNGSTQYLATGVVPASQWAWVIRLTDTSADGVRVAFGSAPSAVMAYFEVISRLGGGHYYGQGGQSEGMPGIPSADSVYGATGQVGYSNGAPEASGIVEWSGVGLSVYVGCRHGSGGPVYFFAGNIAGVAIYNAAITAPQMAAVSAAMAAL